MKSYYNIDTSTINTSKTLTISTNKDKMCLDLLLHEEQFVSEDLIVAHGIRNRKKLIFIVETDDGKLKKVDGKIGEEIVDEDVLSVFDLHFGYMGEFPETIKPVALGRNIIALRDENKCLLVMTSDGKEIQTYTAN
jgi:hypothetical protein